ncbi:hypothetical protein [Paracoccus shanxieyensis]|jgi:predicted acetyltransferase|uniref:GNAT family N-acetyltransferase n=1 Tax=Paracoccus shanxieyensis TaxID=2675752 RepID=A0A6L6IZQ6_9RHOB|nr:hypothetical protein [Paracoccus shanxieyensis]MTH66026.1 hypothetical protein [Paracoccus shanxieyensis]MTH89064.1 hypothetical protein [Paracoccus shanxieyensis]
MARVDMMLTLAGFDEALRSGRIKTARMQGNEKIQIHQDMPDGRTPRLTYARTKGSGVTAVTVITTAEPIDGMRCFHLGYAVREDQRGKGLAKDLASAAVTDFVANIVRNGMREFCIEAIVDRDNPVSGSVARAVLGVDPIEKNDTSDGTPIWQFVKVIT